MIAANENRLELLLEAAQCIWEAVIEPPMKKKAEKVRSKVGTVELRYMLRNNELLHACLDGWDIIQATNDGCMVPYDWKYIPWFVEVCLDWNVHEAQVTLRDEWKALCLVKATE